MTTSALGKRFGQRLRTLRRQSGLTQQRLADLSYMTRRHVQYLERGERLPRIDTLLALAKALGVDPGHLLRLR